MSKKKTVAAPVAVPMVEVVKEAIKPSESEKIWAEIQNVELGMFGLMGQFVHKHVTKINLPGDSLYIKLKSTAVLPAMETALGRKYSFELVDSYVLVKRQVNSNEQLKQAERQMEKDALAARARAAVHK